MRRKRSLCLPTRLDQLERIYEAVDELGESEEWPPGMVYQVKLVLEELGVNIVTHGHANDPDHEFEVVLDSDPEALTIELRDEGPAFNPLTDSSEPDIESGVEDRPVGGLGIYLVRTMMDELSYRRENDKNVLTIVKRKENG
ncbi:MAG: ATP-binding protein [Gemmatimonadetes bacterium]|nr:ATP-binding protein [Gemmatimonadota bacterium]